jgi:hypothetical protein
MRREKRDKRGRKRKQQCAHLEGVITFYGSTHALRAEKVLKEADYEAVLIPGPREISPNCGVALRFDYSRLENCEELLKGKSVQYEAFHHYPER